MADLQMDPANPPMSIREISEKAHEFTWNPSIQFKYWARAADTIHHEGHVYLSERNLAEAYMLFLRYCTLVCEHLPSHPEYNSHDPFEKREARRVLRPHTARVQDVLQGLEELKPHLEQSYNKWLRLKSPQRYRLDATGLDRADRPDTASDVWPGPRTAEKSPADSDAALSWNHVSRARILDAEQNQQLAVELAKEEMQRRLRRRRQAGISPEEEHRRRGAGFWEDWKVSEDDRPPSSSRARAPDDDDDDAGFQTWMEDTRQRLDWTDRHSVDSGTQLNDYSSSLESSPVSPTYRYPSITKSSPLEYTAEPSFNTSNVRRTLPEPLIPTRPPKEPLLGAPRAAPPLPPAPASSWSPPPSSPAPPRPSSDLFSDLHLPRRPSSSRGAEAFPSSTLSSKPPKPPPQKRVTFRPASYLENGDPMRPVFLPHMLRDKFTHMAAPNTRRGVEMCGILCGSLVNNALFISCLVIPEQRGTPDTCEMENEEVLVEYCMTHDLIVVGWIHTHPTQTCFMSSRDLHTHAAYQAMMPESIAIVCAPQHDPSWGIFRLTNPPGLPHVLACRQSETFHQHNISNIYTDATHPTGHVYLSRTLDFEVVDQRSSATRS